VLINYQEILIFDVKKVRKDEPNC